MQSQILNTIHIVDDSNLVIQSLKILLEKNGYKIESSLNGKDALLAIEKNKPDLIILDVKMPIMDGQETIKHLKKSKSTKDIPVIFHTASDKPDVINNLFELGACDYIIKPFIAQELLARVKKELKNITLQNMLTEKISKLAEILSTDSLTKTSNKMHMTSIIKTKLQNLNVQKKGIFSLIYIDIDNFNNFIKINGINTLDITIKKISMIIKRSIRTKDILSHWSGDEFMVLFQHINESDLNKIASTIRENISKAPFGSNSHLSCSITITEILDNKDINEVLDILQSRMKEIKKTNKNSIIMSNGRLLV